jgi:glycosyltransferase involved in cell wall biosynthesis
MVVIEDSTNRRPDLWALGPLPPPVTGMTLLTEQVLRRLQSAGRVTFLNWSPGLPANRMRAKFKRFFRTLGCLLRLLRHGRVQHARLYIVCSSKAGLLMTGVLVNAGRWLGYRVYLHHHTYYYLDRHDWRMAWIDRSLGPHGVHIVHCPQMAGDFRATYPTQHRFEFLLPSVFALPVGQPRQSTAVPFRLGHLGNLMVDKGLDLALETACALYAKGRAVRLRLAGPCYTREARRMVQRALRENACLVEYVGPVYGQAKADFLGGIDCFLLPSRSESWGIVLNEAMAAAVPVIACRRGCSATLVGDRAGLIVDHEARYVELAVKQIEAWIDHADEYRGASQAAVQQAEYLHQQGQLQLDQFAERMFEPLDAA